jgi:putative FmdB family regulatory protein
MPIYEYVCSHCRNRTEILHGVHDDGPTFCPACGAEDSMRKAFAAPAIVFKGSGWAKKERRSAAPAGSKKEPGDGPDAGAKTDGTGSKAEPAASSTSGAASDGSGAAGSDT